MKLWSADRAESLDSHLNSSPSIRISPMRYDLTFIGDTRKSRTEAIRAARNNRLVSIVRATFDRNSLFDVPVDELDWAAACDWRSLCNRFLEREESVLTELAIWGIDFFEGEIVTRESNEIAIQDARGKIRSFRFDMAHDAEVLKRRGIPDWLQAEVPQILSLNRLSNLHELPRRIVIEGTDISAFRAAVVLSRLGCSVVLISNALEPDERDSEWNALWKEARVRGVELIPQADVLCVQEHGSAEFEFFLNDGRTLQSELYVYATEPVAPEFDDELSPGNLTEPSTQFATS